MTTRIFILFFICFSIGFSQNTHTLSGIVYEKEGQETLIGANIIIPALNTGTTTNEYGFYSNVNPDVSHPRWSQASERRLPNSLLKPNRMDTLPFNGYADQVAGLYRGMDLKRNF